MAKTVLDLEVLRGETWTLNMELSQSGVLVPLDEVVIHFVVVEDYGLPPVIRVASTDVGQTTVNISTPGIISIVLTNLETLFQFTVGHYAVIYETEGTTISYLLVGDLKVIETAGQVE